MKCIIPEEDNKSAYGTVIVRRKFVPIKFTIHRENQFLNAGAKLPFTTSKVIGLLTSSRIEKKCSDLPLPPRYYYGISDSEIKDTSFLEINNGATYNTPYPPDGFSNGIFIDQWWYYVHPILDRFPVLIDNGIFERLIDPIEIAFKQEGQCTADQYYLWSGKLPDNGFSLITFFPPS